MQQRIWILITRKLLNEASGNELAELNNLLQHNDQLAHQYEVIASYWEHYEAAETRATELCFEQLAAKM